MNHPAQPAPEGANPSYCFWPTGCSDRARCWAFKGCVADAQNKAARLAREKPNDAASVAAQLANDPQAEIGVLRLIKADLEEDNAALRARCERLEGALARTANSLRSLIATVETMDSDERYRAREERRSALVHTSELKQSQVALDEAERALAQPKDGK